MKLNAILFGVSLLNDIIYFKILLIVVSLVVLYYARLMIKLNRM